MKLYDFDAVVYEGDVYCVGCLPEGVDLEDEEVHPIFASEEWDSAPACTSCGEIHDYMAVLDEDEEEVS